MSEEIKLHSKPKTQGKVAVFGIVRNEMYFLPHLLEHYRRLDVKDFWFHDDQSDDGTFEFLMSQPDVGVTRSNMRFGDMIGDKKFDVLAKTIIPQNLLRNRWVATIDSDEFMVLPPGIDTLPQLTESLERNNLLVARALMMDFFPETLRSLRDADTQRTPFELCPYFDPWERLVWPDQHFNVTDISVVDGVRPRILKELLQRNTPFPEFMKDYKIANVNKTPIAFWNENMVAFSSHRTSVAPSDKVQLILAHFKFYPGHEARTDAAVVTGVHWKSASEYHILKAANERLMDWPLRGPRTQQFRGKDDLAQTGLLYTRAI